jgi:excisionase family DNA binding protein
MSSTTQAPTPETIKTETQTENTANAEQLSEVLTADEVASLLRVSRKSVYTFFRKGEIPGGRRIGAALRFSRTRVLQWLAEGQERAPRSPRGAR